MIGTAAAILGGSVLGGIGSAIAGNQAAGAAQAASNAANRTQLQIFNQQREDQAPWRAAGGQAINQLSQMFNGGGNPQLMMQNLQNSPGYQFRLTEGQNQLDRLAARGGSFFSGRALQGAQQYGQNFASNEFGNYINQLNAISGIGQNSVQNTGQAGQNYANQYGQNVNGAAATRGSAYLNTANSLNSLIGQGIGLYGMGGFGNGGGGGTFGPSGHW